MSLKWPEQVVFNFIDHLRDFQLLWDLSHPSYKLLKKKDAAWKAILQTMQEDGQTSDGHKQFVENLTISKYRLYSIILVVYYGMSNIVIAFDY